MKVAVRYYTKTGNTKRLAEALAKAVGVEALPISVPVTEVNSSKALIKTRLQKSSTSVRQP